MFHGLSHPYTPQQNVRAKRKQCHIIEIGLSMIFNAHVLATYWVDAFSLAT